MTEQKEHLQAISDIRSMMERSSRCISLSGLSGVFAGIFALIGAFFAYEKMQLLYIDLYARAGAVNFSEIFVYLLCDASLVLIASLTV
ncbi:MAG: hypothetical protein ACXVPY_13600 [Bacteroidia bacterium]